MREHDPRRRLRESPRAVAISVLLAALLILIGILVAGTAATGTTHTTKIITARPGAATAASAAAAARIRATQAALRVDQVTLTQMRTLLNAQASQLSGAAATLNAARADARCWHAKAIHPIKTRARRCAPPGP